MSLQSYIKKTNYASKAQFSCQKWFVQWGNRIKIG